MFFSHQSSRQEPHLGHQDIDSDPIEFINFALHFVFISKPPHKLTPDFPDFSENFYPGKFNTIVVIMHKFAFTFLSPPPLHHSPFVGRCFYINSWSAFGSKYNSRSIGKPMGFFAALISAHVKLPSSTAIPETKSPKYRVRPILLNCIAEITFCWVAHHFSIHIINFSVIFHACPR